MLKKDANTAHEQAKSFDDQARRLESLYNQSKLRYFWRYVLTRETSSSVQQASKTRYSVAGRKIEESQDDKRLARQIWASLASEAFHSGVKVFLEGELFRNFSEEI